MAKISLPNGWVPRDYQLPLWHHLQQGGRRAVAVWHRYEGMLYSGMGNLLDIVGQRFGRLLVLGCAEPDANKRTRWLVRCDCGVEKAIDGAHMRYGRIRSCGCLQDELASEHGRKHLARFAGHNRSHGMSRTPIYMVWKAMIQRCRNPNDAAWQYYGGIGIAVCERWQKFENFYADMGNAPPGLSIDRIDPFGNYDPSNCRWANSTEQRRNTRRHAQNTAS